MTQKVRIYQRTVETDTWRPVSGELLACINVLNPNSARKESILPEPDITHVCRMQIANKPQAGQRLRRLSDGEEFNIRTVREVRHPMPGHVKVLLSAEKAI